MCNGAISQEDHDISDICPECLEGCDDEEEDD
jgi:hypothetical protein